jgi:hypothetical protein
MRNGRRVSAGWAMAATAGLAVIVDYDEPPAPATKHRPDTTYTATRNDTF